MKIDGMKIRKLLDYYFKGEDIVMDKDTPVANADSPFFPFGLEDLQYWVVKRKDGMIVKYRVVGPNDDPKTVSSYPVTPPYVSTPSLSGWCQHKPADEPVWVGDGLDLYIADAPGCRGYKDEFDFVLDCGDILPLSYIRNTSQSILDGDEELVKLLSKYGTDLKHQPRVVQVDWEDRAAPPLTPAFWPALYKKLLAMGGTALTACQGGHGRSGTSLVCLMMCANPEYSPADAIIHLRAIHCARAIESTTQHNYINMVGKFLKREGDVERVKGIKDFKDAFMKLTLPSCKPYQERLNKGGKKG